MAIDKAALLAPRSITSVRDVEIEGLGAVRVRALTRKEVLELQAFAATVLTKDASVAQILDYEARLVATAMVDPEMTVDEVRQWFDISPAGEMEPVCRAIKELSGLEERADRAAFQGS